MKSEYKKTFAENTWSNVWVVIFLSSIFFSPYYVISNSISLRRIRCVINHFLFHHKKKSSQPRNKLFGNDDVTANAKLLYKSKRRVNLFWEAISQAEWHSSVAEKWKRAKGRKEKKRAKPVQYRLHLSRLVLPFILKRGINFVPHSRSLLLTHLPFLSFNNVARLLSDPLFFFHLNCHETFRHNVVRYFVGQRYYYNSANYEFSMRERWYLRGRCTKFRCQKIEIEIEIEIETENVRKKKWRRNKVLLGAWREISSCPIFLPPLSEYEWLDTTKAGRPPGWQLSPKFLGERKKERMREREK